MSCNCSDRDGSVGTRTPGAIAATNHSLEEVKLQLQQVITALQRGMDQMPPAQSTKPPILFVEHPVGATSQPVGRKKSPITFCSGAWDSSVETVERFTEEFFRSFLVNCFLVFTLRPHIFHSEATKVVFVVNHLTRRARLWGPTYWEKQKPVCTSFDAFAH